VPLEREKLVDGLRAAWYWLGCWGCRVFCMLFFRLRTYGRENIPKKGAFLLVSNHQSYLDPIFCGAPLQRQLFYVARDSLFEHRLLGWLISTIKTIPVKRGKPDTAAIRKIIRRLNQGKGVCLFPEGTRSNDGRISTFMGGFGLLSRRGGARIVPVVIDGAFECWPRHKRIFARGGHILVRYGKAIPLEQARQMNNEQLTLLVTDTLRRMQNELRLKHGKKPYDY
jgi:1-acyl-sn-glycerol-3-phosphate acyltransferase